MKKHLTLITLLSALALTLTACGGTEETSSPQTTTQQTEAPTETEAPADTEAPAETEAPEPQLLEVESCQADADYFSEYTYNPCLSTGNNAFIRKAENITYRAYIPIEEYGDLEYSFYFSNTVDSTYSKGKPVYVGKPGEEFTIVSAKVYDGGESPEDDPVELGTVTFDGSDTKDVTGGEVYHSDPVTLDIPEGHYLLWEWTLNGRGIPALNMAELSIALQKGENDEDFGYCSDVPLPVFIGAKREKVTNRVVTVGDSITQGCQTEQLKFEYWAGQIAFQLPETASLYNAGLGWARMSDFATCGNWLGRTVNCDTAVIAFGTNDIGSGEFEGDGGNSADEILSWTETVIAQFKAADVKNIIVFNAPPFDYPEDKEAVRVEYNEKLRTLCETYGVEYFDFASYLSDPDDPAKARYGGHPNGEGGKLVADAFMDQYAELFE